MPGGGSSEPPFFFGRGEIAQANRALQYPGLQNADRLSGETMVFHLERNPHV